MHHKSVCSEKVVSWPEGEWDLRRRWQPPSSLPDIALQSIGFWSFLVWALPSNFKMRLLNFPAYNSLTDSLLEVQQTLSRFDGCREVDDAIKKVQKTRRREKSKTEILYRTSADVSNRWLEDIAQWGEHFFFNSNCNHLQPEMTRHHTNNTLLGNKVQGHFPTSLQIEDLYSLRRSDERKNGPPTATASKEWLHRVGHTLQIRSRLTSIISLARLSVPMNGSADAVRPFLPSAVHGIFSAPFDFSPEPENALSPALTLHLWLLSSGCCQSSCLYHTLPAAPLLPNWQLHHDLLRSEDQLLMWQ